MSIPQKGSRKIICRNQCYRWRVSRDKKISAWSVDPSKVDPLWLEIARQKGLGAVAEMRITVAIEAFEKPMGRIILHVLGTTINGFLGFEHNIQIKPQLIQTVIEQALDEGWNPQLPQEFKVVFCQEAIEPFRPAMLLLGDGRIDVLHHPYKVKFPEAASDLL